MDVGILLSSITSGWGLKILFVLREYNIYNITYKVNWNFRFKTHWITSIKVHMIITSIKPIFNSFYKNSAKLKFMD